MDFLRSRQCYESNNRERYEPSTETPLPEAQRSEMMKTSKKVSNIPPMDDEDLAKFWEKHEPEDFEGWGKGDLDFRRPPFPFHWA